MDTISHTAIWETALEVYQAEYGDEGTYDEEIEAIPTKELEESDYKNLRLAVDTIDILSKRLARSQKKLDGTIKSNRAAEDELVAQRHDAEHLQGLVQAENDKLIDENKQLKEQVEELEVEVDKLNEECDHRAPGDDYDALEISCDILREENECNKKNFLKTLDENKKLKAENERLHRDVECRAKQLETYLSMIEKAKDYADDLKERVLWAKWDGECAEMRGENPQYTIDDEICGLREHVDDPKIIKKMFDEKYDGQYEYVIETGGYRAVDEEESEEE